MEIIKEVMESMGKELIVTITLAIVAVLANAIKALFKKYIDDKTASDVVKTCVKAVEQMYHDLHGEEKLGKCLESVSGVLSEKGISISDTEMKLLIESAVAEFNDVFNKSEPSETTEK